jgi:hypothetical protein
MADYFRTRKEDVLKAVLEKLAIDKELDQQLQAAMKDFKSFYKR